MSNPLLSDVTYPLYDQVDVSHVKPAITRIISENQETLSELVKQESYTWETLAIPMEEMDDRLQKAWSVIGNLNAVKNSDELRDVYNECVQLITSYQTEIGQNVALWKAYQALSESPEFDSYNQQQKQAIKNILRDFHLSGVDLPESDKQLYLKLSQQLAEKTSKFSDNVLDVTQAWLMHHSSDERLSGIPQSALEQAAATAKSKGLEGFVFTLDFPSYLPVMTYCDDRTIREEMYVAFSTRASDQGPYAGQWDNTDLITEILSLRDQQARLLGFDNYSSLSLAPKMAESIDEVVSFLRELSVKSKPHALKEVEELKLFAKDQCGLNDLQAWDAAYVSEKLKQHSYNISQEEVRAYFPLPKVLSGLFECVHRLFDIVIKPGQTSTWHKDVLFYEVHRDGKQVAAFYLDVFARNKKRGGAWMAGARNRRITAKGQLQLPVAYLTCNFTPPGENTPSLLTHSEVTTMFHEFGHGLHHMLTEMDVSEVSGINGVPWDAVELPSQFLENWCWHAESLPLISEHYETGEPLPADMLERMLAAKNFQAGMQMQRQLEFALFDIQLHTEFSSEHPIDPLKLLSDVRDEVAVLCPPEYNRFANSFTHIFAGGYAAGYYSYKWAEVLAADAFSKFEENGIFDKQTGHEFLQSILRQGGSMSPMALFIEFRGRRPSVDAIIRQSGLA